MSTELERAASSLLISLRMGEGLDSARLDHLRAALTEAAEQWTQRDSVPRSTVALLVALYPDFEAASYGYPNTQAEEIQEAARQLSEHILSLL